MKNRIISETLYQKILTLLGELPAKNTYDLITEWLQVTVKEEIPLPKDE